VANNTWSSTGSSDGNLGSNWSLGSLSATDTLIYSNTSTINCTFTAPVSCAAVTVNATYTGTFNDGGYAFTVAGAVSITPGGTFTSSGIWTQTGDANFSLLGINTFNVSSMQVVLQGTGSFIINKPNTRILSLTCAASGKVTTISTMGTLAGISSGSSDSLLMGGGTLTLSSDLVVLVIGTCTPFTQNGTINGNYGLGIRLGASSITVTIPAITHSGTSTGSLLGVGSYIGDNSTIDLSGALTTSGSGPIYMTLGGNATGTNSTINTNDYAITVGGTFFIGGATASKTLTVNLGASTITCNYFDIDTYRLGTINVNSTGNITSATGVYANQSSGTITSSGTWTITGDGNFIFGANMTYSVASLTLDLQGTGYLYVSKGNVTFYRLSCAYTGKVTTVNSASVTTIFAAGDGGAPLVLNGGTFTCNTNIIESRPLVDAPWVSGTYTAFNGAGQFAVRPGADGVTVSSPAMTITMGIFYFYYVTGFTTGITTLTGNFNLTGSLSMGNGTAGGTFTFNTGDFSLSAGNITNFGNSAGGTFVFNAGASAITITGFNTAGGLLGTGTTLNMATSSWSCSGSWTFGASLTVTHTSDTVTFTNTATVTLSAGHFQNLIINASGKTITLASNITLYGNFTLTAGTVSAATAYILFSGATALITLSASLTCRLYTVVADQVITWNTGANSWTIPGPQTSSYGTNFSGTSGHPVVWVSSSPGTPYKVINATGNILGSNFLSVTDCDSSGGNVMYASAISGTTNWLTANVWSAAANSTWNVNGNWSLGHIPTSTEVAFFGAVSTKNCTVDTTPSTGAFVAISTYTGNFVDGGNAFTIASGIYNTTNNTFNCSGIWTVTGDSGFYFATTGTATISSWIVVLQGTGNCSLISAGSGTNLLSLTCAASGKVTTIDGANSTLGKLTLGTGTLTVTSTGLTLSPTATDFLTNAGATINGTTNITISISANAVNINFPTFNYSGSGTLLFQQGTSLAVSTTMQGIISSTGPITIQGVQANTFLFDMNNNSFSTTGIFQIGTTNAGATLNLYFRNSTVSCASFPFTVGTTGTTNLYMGGSNITCAGSWTFQTTRTTVDPGTSTLNINNTSTLTLTGGSLCNLAIDASGKTITFATNITLTGNFTMTAGTLAAATYYIILTGATPTIALSGNITSRLRTATNDQVVTWNTGSNIWSIPVYLSSDFGGTAGHLVSWVGTGTYTIFLPYSLPISYLSMRDIKMSGALMDARNGTNMDSGNNQGISFAYPSTTVNMFDGSLYN
jgi:hypothetical protein